MAQEATDALVAVLQPLLQGLGALDSALPALESLVEALKGMAR